jgi:hypothetical protein
MLSGTTQVCAGISGVTGAPRPTLLNAAGCSAVEHDSAVTATDAASANALFDALIIDIPLTSHRLPACLASGFRLPAGIISE